MTGYLHSADIESRVQVCRCASSAGATVSSGPLEWHSSSSPTIGTLLGHPVIESELVPRGEIYLASGHLHLRDVWFDLQLPVMIGDMRKAMRAHLADLVAAAELRLGLDRP